MKILILIVLSFASLSQAENERQFLMDHDGAGDDYVAMSLLMSAADVRLNAVTVTPADSYRKAAIDTTLAFLKLYKHRIIPVAVGSSAGTNAFPEAWRKESNAIAKMRELSVPRAERAARGFTRATPAQQIVETLSSGPHEILVTGPLTNIAAAIRRDRRIIKNIRRLTFMGGALEVAGNVSQDGRKPVAEWNVFNDPAAINVVLRAGVPVRFVGLDATNQAPVTHRFLARVTEMDFSAARIFGRIWSKLITQIEHPDPQRRYYFWDSLAAPLAIHPEWAIVRREKVSVVEKPGPREGQLILDPSGWLAEVVTGFKGGDLEALVLAALGH